MFIKQLSSYEQIYLIIATFYITYFVSLHAFDMLFSALYDVYAHFELSFAVSHTTSLIFDQIPVV